ncbi:hypothetical protein HO133_002953 [Letharia lupina]|uniref:Amidase domain-containing protein n=1 Tax=Letharia lupina TaxID=560253 RepID=A0A8H6F9U6_9LECA|nr:uncharacterized protein HO133_002953 [Letharia lupina]KAF6220520.1 hypothetical protein HO133_002953 [Letharia lupina]
MLRSVRTYFLSPKAHNTVRTETEVRRHHDLSQQDISPLFRLEELKGLNLYECSMEEIQQHLSEGHFTSVDYVEFCLRRIYNVNPYLECIIEINPDATKIAAELDDERRQGKARGILHGVPILVKDNMATKDKMQTTAGSWALLGSIVPRDAHVVSLLRRAGAIILGHANMSEWASVRSSNYSTGYSPRGGQVRNPYNLSSSPYGSSSGSAVAVSANIVPVSFGTETDTSIIGPASINGIVGIKPTLGLTSRAGVIPISKSMDTVGSFGRTVADAVHGLNAIVGSDERDAMTCSSSRSQRKDYSKYLTTKGSLKGARFGLPNKRCWEFVAKDIRETALTVLKAIQEAGADVVEVDFPCAEDRIPGDGNWDWTYGKPSESEFSVVKVEAFQGINAYLSELSETRMKTLEDVFEYNQKNSGTEGAKPGDHSAFPTGQNNFQQIIQSCGEATETYYQALHYTQQKCRTEGIDAALKDNKTNTVFDALILFDRKGAGQQLAAQAGYPIICIPIGVDSAGLPFSLSLQHTAWKEDVLIRWASAIEDLVHQISGWRCTPEYREHLSKNIPVVDKSS